MSTATLRHDALIYGSEQEFLDPLVPFVRDGLERGEPVVAVTTGENIRQLRDALGATASRVEFVDATAWYRHPLQTIAGYRQVIDERLGNGASRVRAIGEVQFGEDARSQRDWLRYEAALNRVFATTPAWIVCPYDRRSLPETVVRHAAATHPYVVEQGRPRHSPSYLAPEAFVRQQAAPAPIPALPAAELEIGDELAPARRKLRDLAASAGLGVEETDQLTIAVNEALTNAILHGRPPVRLRVYSHDSTVECEIIDAGGRFSDPLAGYEPPRPDRPRQTGMGLWVIRQLCDRVELVPTADHTVLRLSKTARQLT